MTKRSKAVMIAILISVIWVLCVTVFSWFVTTIEELFLLGHFDIEGFFTLFIILNIPLIIVWGLIWRTMRE
jgi:hypothetical protein